MTCSMRRASGTSGEDSTPWPHSELSRLLYYRTEARRVISACGLARSPASCRMAFHQACRQKTDGRPFRFPNHPTGGTTPMVERRKELDQRYQRKKKMAKLKSKLASAKDGRERDTILK